MEDNQVDQVSQEQTQTCPIETPLASAVISETTSSSNENDEAISNPESLQANGNEASSNEVKEEVKVQREDASISAEVAQTTVEVNCTEQKNDQITLTPETSNHEEESKQDSSLSAIIESPKQENETTIKDTATVPQSSEILTNEISVPKVQENVSQEPSEISIDTVSAEKVVELNGENQSKSTETLVQQKDQQQVPVVTQDINTETPSKTNNDASEISNEKENAIVETVQTIQETTVTEAEIINKPEDTTITHVTDEVKESSVVESITEDKTIDESKKDEVEKITPVTPAQVTITDSCPNNENKPNEGSKINEAIPITTEVDSAGPSKETMPLDIQEITVDSKDSVPTQVESIVQVIQSESVSTEAKELKINEELTQSDASQVKETESKSENNLESVQQTRAEPLDEQKSQDLVVLSEQTVTTVQSEVSNEFTQDVQSNASVPPQDISPTQDINSEKTDQPTTELIKNQETTSQEESSSQQVETVKTIVTESVDPKSEVVTESEKSNDKSQETQVIETNQAQESASQSTVTETEEASKSQSISVIGEIATLQNESQEVVKTESSTTEEVTKNEQLQDSAPQTQEIHEVKVESSVTEEAVEHQQLEATASQSQELAKPEPSVTEEVTKNEKVEETVQSSKADNVEQESVQIEVKAPDAN